MKILLKSLLTGLCAIGLLITLSGCSCGFDCNNDDNDDSDKPAVLSLGFSDSLPEDLKQVVIEVDTITFRRSGVEDVVVDNFTIEALDLVDAPTFQINLLDYQGVTDLLVIDELEMIVGTYSTVAITILTSDENQSYVQQADDDAIKALKVTSGFSSLSGMTLSSGSQRFTVEFGLAQALQYQTSSDTYLLTTNGVRIENQQKAASLSGSVDSTLFDTEQVCSEKADPLKGNRVYLYQGNNLQTENLADVFTTESTTTPPENAIAPFAVASMATNPLTGEWAYSFGFVPAGSYTIAFSCNTAEDGPIEYNGLEIPLPSNQKYTTTLAEGDKGLCNLTSEGTSC